MAYCHSQLFSEVDGLLSVRPRLRLCELARSLNVGSQTLKKAVEEATGSSFREYQKEKILERCRCLILRDVGLLQKQVALLIGYRSPDAFSRFIKRVTGKGFSENRQHLSDSRPPSL